MTELERIHAEVLPAAYALLPAHMASREASAMLLAIGLQESRFEHRVQIGGPAHGYWQFERGGGVKGCLTHAGTKPLLLKALGTLGVAPDTETVYQAIINNDVLAAIMARLLLWTLPDKLPDAEEPERGWFQYLRAWRPGKPHIRTWDAFYAQAWEMV